MANHIEWAYAGDGYSLLHPADLADLADDDGDVEGDSYGIALGDTVIVYGTADELFRTLAAALAALSATGQVGDFT